jgi:hypothetical protein
MVLGERYWQTKTHLSKKEKNNLIREEKLFSEKIINSKSNTMVTRTAVETFPITKGLGVK